jgi:type IV pilus assembly protein PilX
MTTERKLRANLSKFHAPGQRGVALIITLVLLTGVALLALAANRSSVLENKASTGGRDYQIALAAAESALSDLRSWMAQDTNGKIFASHLESTALLQKGGCPLNDTITKGTTVTVDRIDGLYDLGACTFAKAFWQEKTLAQLKDLTVAVGNNPMSVGSYPVKSASYPTGSSEAPRYMVDIIPDTSPGEDASRVKYLYRVTALGFGPTDSSVVLLQETMRAQD